MSWVPCPNATDCNFSTVYDVSEDKFRIFAKGVHERDDARFVELSRTPTQVVVRYECLSGASTGNGTQRIGPFAAPGDVVVEIRQGDDKTTHITMTQANGFHIGGDRWRDCASGCTASSTGCS